ncbi:hypothetical protein [Spongiactinospora sp. 9N601]|uniref:hypothetical protein n=1 Tax=Spongiactinospora sp. 9N601 TaxID=3375149 RepID=UPI0037B6EE03
MSPSFQERPRRRIMTDVGGDRQAEGGRDFSWRVRSASHQDQFGMRYGFLQPFEVDQVRHPRSRQYQKPVR